MEQINIANSCVYSCVFPTCTLSSCQHCISCKLCALSYDAQVDHHFQKSQLSVCMFYGSFWCDPQGFFLTSESCHIPHTRMVSKLPHVSSCGFQDTRHFWNHNHTHHIQTKISRQHRYFACLLWWFLYHPNSSSLSLSDLPPPQQYMTVLYPKVLSPRSTLCRVPLRPW